MLRQLDGQQAPGIHSDSAIDDVHAGAGGRGAQGHPHIGRRLVGGQVAELQPHMVEGCGLWVQVWSSFAGGSGAESCTAAMQVQFAMGRAQQRDWPLA